MTTTKKIEKELVSYKKLLEDSYKDDAWKYFDYEELLIHSLWNGYRCSKCRSMHSVKNKDGLCIKCLVLREKIDTVNKIINQMKGGKDIWKEIQKLTSRHLSQ